MMSIHILFIFAKNRKEFIGKKAICGSFCRAESEISDVVNYKQFKKIRILIVVR